jgi:hypothetical protein
MNAINTRETKPLRKQTRSILDELTDMSSGRDRNLLLESRGNHIINSAINLITMLRENYTPEQADDLERRLINSIRGQDPAKFSRGLRKYEIR